MTLQYVVGDRVRTLDSVRPARFASQGGVVRVLNHGAGEVGVVFGKRNVTVWFRPEELTLKRRARGAVVPVAGRGAPGTGEDAPDGSCARVEPHSESAA